MSFSIPQCRAARALLNWSANELADRAGVGIATVRRFEGGSMVATETITALRNALEAAGIAFISDGERSSGGAGVRFKDGRTT